MEKKGKSSCQYPSIVSQDYQKPALLTEQPTGSFEQVSLVIPALFPVL